MTNHEKIKAMSLEEMANFLDLCGCPKVGCTDDYFKFDCVQCITYWLNSPAESETEQEAQNEQID